MKSWISLCLAVLSISCLLLAEDYLIDCWGFPYSSGCWDSQNTSFTTICSYLDGMAPGSEITGYQLWVYVDSPSVDRYTSLTINAKLNGITIGSCSRSIPPADTTMVVIDGVVPADFIYNYRGSNDLQLDVSWQAYLQSDKLCIDRARIIFIVQHNPFKIIQPSTGSDYDLNQMEMPQTESINFQAGLEPVSIDRIDWNVALQYRTLGNRCSECDYSFSFSNAPYATTQRTFSSMGGQVAVNASAIVNEQVLHAAPAIFTITGHIVEESDITNQLVSLYHGQTPNLMTGLAMKESTYMQFKIAARYNRADYWPYESYDGGSHIGLMQVPTNMNRAWNWHENTSFGVDWFSREKKRIADLRERQIKQEARQLYKCHLRNLEADELENMTLVLYGPEASDRLDGQYYYYKVTKDANNQDVCEWILNTQGNQTGVDYADTVRELMK